MQNSSAMDGLRSVWRRSGESPRLPKRDEQMTLAESLLSEVEYHIQEIERKARQQRRDEQKIRTGVDYSWLISEVPKPYKVPQLERLELEELCLKLEPGECSKVVALFRDANLREPCVEELARIMRSCVIQVLDQRPRTPSFSNSMQDWVNRRTTSMWSLKLKSTTRVRPAIDENDIEMQNERVPRSTRAFSVPTFTVTTSDVTSCRANEYSTGTLPV